MRSPISLPLIEIVSNGVLVDEEERKTVALEPIPLTVLATSLEPVILSVYAGRSEVPVKTPKRLQPRFWLEVAMTAVPIVLWKVSNCKFRLQEPSTPGGSGIVDAKSLPRTVV